MNNSIHQLDLNNERPDLLSPMRVVFVHDWITGLRGGERCLLEFLKLYPDADIVTLFHVSGVTSEEIDKRVRQTSFLQRIPGIKKIYRYLFPLYPFAVRNLKLEGYDLVISLSHAAAKNVTVPKGVPHICYCFTPMRYIWDQVSTYFGQLRFLLWPLLLVLRWWDKRASRGVTHFVAISTFVAARIRCFYGRSAAVVYPPVENSWITPAQLGQRGVAFLYAGALVPYKRVDLVIAACEQLGQELWIVGDGPELEKLREQAGRSTHFFGHVSDQDLADFYRRARALIFPVREDFGMVPIECLAAGRPVIALDDGAASESLRAVRHWRGAHKLAPKEACGVFMRKQRTDASRLSALREALQYFIAHETEFSVESCVERAKEFSAERFRSSWEKEADAVRIQAPNPRPDVPDEAMPSSSSARVRSC
jgi:glycosyltransferase involved in cell wall biosynthesis